MMPPSLAWEYWDDRSAFAAKSAIGKSLRHCGAQVVDCGVNCDPEDLIEAARRDDAHAIVISTHNGVARSYGVQLA